MHRVFKYPLKVFVRERERGEKKHKTRGRERFYGDKLEGKGVKSEVRAGEIPIWLLWTYSPLFLYLQIKG